MIMIPYPHPFWTEPLAARDKELWPGCPCEVGEIPDPEKFRAAGYTLAPRPERTDMTEAEWLDASGIPPENREGVVTATLAVVHKPMDPNPRQPNDVFLLEEATERGWWWTLAMRPGGVTGTIWRNQHEQDERSTSASQPTLRQVVDILAVYAIEQDGQAELT